MNLPNAPLKMEALYYNEGQIGEVSVVSVTFGDNGRRLMLGMLANGDRLQVPIPDIVAKPHIFLAPCGKPFSITGGTVEDPCEEIPEQESLEAFEFTADLEPMGTPPSLIDQEAQFVSAFGSRAAMMSLQQQGYFTMESLSGLSEEKLVDIVGAKAAASYRRYTNDDGKKRRPRRTKDAPAI